MTGAFESVLVPIRLNTIVILQSLAQPGDRDLDDVIRRLIEEKTKREDRTSEKSEREPLSRHGNAARYRLTILDETCEAASLGEVVATAVDVLGELDPRLFHRARELVGNLRRYLAERPEDLYPGRPDLVHCARRCRCGWWVPTNISRRDTCRILERFCGVLGLNWGEDVRLEE